MYRHVPFDRYVVLFPPSLVRVPMHFSIRFPVVIGTTGSYVSSAPIAFPLRFPLIDALAITSMTHDAEVWPKFLGNPSEHVPRARDSGGSSRPRFIGLADAAFRQANSVGFHNDKRFRS